jgi:peptidyl-prolyl cis-trans isomerase D
MITWMQRHKKWLIITIWISTIAFVGAGFVGWGQYSYGDKAGAVAKVGNVEITMGELQKGYSKLYSQYAQVFKGNFDEEKAKQFGLQKQALQQLVEEALLINLAQSYDLTVSDEEVIANLKTQKYFFKDGVFNKDIYKQILSQNRLSTKEYESDLRKTILIQKMFKLLPVEISENEEKIVNTLVSIADKINYTKLKLEVDTSDAMLKPYWEVHKNEFLSDKTYDVEYIELKQLNNEYTDEEISKYYTENKTHFKADDGKILPLVDAKDKIIDEMNQKATKDKALRTYIAFKKNKLSDTVTTKTATVSRSNNNFNDEALSKIEKLSITSPFAKPVMIEKTFYTFKLVKINPATPKSFEDAKDEVKPMYVHEAKQGTIKKLITKKVAKFKGTITDFVTTEDADKLTELTKAEAEEFLQKLFTSKQKSGYIQLNNSEVVMYNILEQKLLKKENTKDQKELITKIKTGMFSSGLMKSLQNKYQTEIFIQGL